MEVEVALGVGFGFASVDQKRQALGGFGDFALGMGLLPR